MLAEKFYHHCSQLLVVPIVKINARNSNVSGFYVEISLRKKSVRYYDELFVKPGYEVDLTN